MQNNIQKRQKFLDKISDTLFISFDDDLTIQKIAKLIVPQIADYCRIAILDDSNQIKEIAVNHHDPTKVHLVSELYDLYKDRPENTHGVPHILKTGKPEIISEIDTSVLNTIKDPKLLKVVQTIGLKSYIGVPLIARKRVIGALSISSIKENRFYTKEDLIFVQEVGRRIALALENAKLYSDAKKARLEAEYERQHLKDLFMQTPAIVAILRGEKHIFELVNSQYMQIVGAKKDIIGKSIRTVLPELKGQGFFELLDNVYKSGIPFIGNEMLAKLDKNGNGQLEEIYFNFVYQPFRNARGEIEGIFVHATDVTQQVLVRRSNEDLIQKLDKEQRRLEYGQKAGKIGTYEWEIQTNKSTWTKEYEVLYGYPNGGFRGKTMDEWLKYAHPDDRQKIVDEMKKALKKEDELKIEFRVVWPDKSIHYLTSRAQILRDKKGIPLRMNGVIIDITERKIAEIAFRESEARKSAFFETALDAIITMDEKGNVIEFNPSAEKMFGYTKAEVIGKEMASLIIPKPFRERHRKGLAQYLKLGIGSLLNQRIEIMAMRKTGTLFPVELAIARVPKEGAILFTGTIQDITKRKYSENNIRFISESSKILASSLDYKTTLVNVAKLAVPQIADWCAVDIKTENGLEQLAVAHVDPKKLQLAKKLRKKDPPNIHSSTGVPKVIRTGIPEFYPDISDAMLTQGAKDEEHLAIIRKLSICSLMIVPLTVAKETIGAITFVGAETGRHYTKADLAMAQEVANRAALAIDNARLYTEAQKAIELRDEFISVASHELKTPVTSLKMYTQVLKKQLERTDKEFSTRPLASMDRQINKLMVVISDLLNVSKLQHGKLEFKMEVTDINNVVRETVEVIREIERSHTLIIRGRIHKKVYADKYRIYQVITNLLTNAIKYSGDSHNVIIKLHEGKKYALISVQDFGLGIDKEHQKKIFDQFYRVTSPEEKTYPGLGMGLYIANQIIERHGGKMNVVSNKGKGTTFSLTLPYYTTSK